tara:strand:+ start:50 stop:514 length:465 start_codon:yes stop_codon:yes gene_type:complete
LIKTLSLFIVTILLSSCLTSASDRKARRFYNKEIHNEEVLLFSNYNGALSSSYVFTLRTNNKFAYSGYNLGSKYSVGTWSQRGSSDTIDLNFYRDHGIYAKENYVVIKNLKDSNLIKKSFVKFTPSDSIHGGAKFSITKVNPKLFSYLKLNDKQ